MGAFRIVVAVTANREAVEQSRYKATITNSSGLLRLRLTMTGEVARNSERSSNNDVAFINFDALTLIERMGTGQ
jgi:hypothetical protein